MRVIKKHKINTSRKIRYIRSNDNENIKSVSHVPVPINSNSTVGTSGKLFPLAILIALT